MSDDYLFDRSGTPDRDVVRLEQMLGRLRTKATAPEVRLKPGTTDEPLVVSAFRRTGANDD